MTVKNENIPNDKILIGIDIAKYKHVSLIEYPNGKKERFNFDNSMNGFMEFKNYFSKSDLSITVAIEPTGDYHRALAYFLLKENIQVKLVNTLAMARMREALHGSWDKNDPKDAQVILYMLKNHQTQAYYEPTINNIGGFRELASLHFRISKSKTKIQHNILNHYFPLYFPEGKTYFTGSKTRWFTRFLKHFPVPTSTLEYTEDEFVKVGWEHLFRVPFRERLLRSFYKSCQNTIGIPVSPDSLEAMSFKQTLEDHCQLMEQIKEIEKLVISKLKDDNQFKILTTIPGIGPVIALNIIAESGDIKRFRHCKQYLKYMGLNLCSSQSGEYQGRRRVSKRGNSRLRSVIWLAAKAAIYTPVQTNPFREKYSKMVKGNIENGDIKRIAISTCASKMARLIHALIKKDTIYRLQSEA